MTSSPTTEFCNDEPSVACKFDAKTGKATHYAICISNEDGHYRSKCIRKKDYPALGVGDNYIKKNNSTKEVAECGCCTEGNYPPPATVRSVNSGICYYEEDSLCGKPGDNTFVVCGATSKGTAMVSVCIKGGDKCVDANNVPGDDPSICGECPV